MSRLKNAKSAIKRATDSLVKAAQDSIREEEMAPVTIKADIFKEVMELCAYLIIGSIASFMQKIDAEARVLKFEKELRDAKSVLKQLKQLPLRSVGDIKRVIFSLELIDDNSLPNARTHILDARCGEQGEHSSEKSPGSSGLCA